MSVANYARLILLSLALVGAVTVQGESSGLVDQKSDLEQIQKDLENGMGALDSLKAEELAVQKRINDYDQKIASDRTLIRRLNAQLDNVRQGIAQAETDLTANTDRFDHSRRRYLGNLRQFYQAVRRPIGPVPDHPNDELALMRKISYLRALASFEAVTVAQASDLLERSVVSLEDLTGESQNVSSLKHEKETARALSQSQRQSKQKELAQVLREKTRKADEVLMLQQAAQEMEMIIARLEQQRQAAQAEGQEVPGESVFASLKSHLSCPFRGKIVTAFGESVDPVTNLKSFSPGISIKGRAGGEVSAVAAGVVAYIGELRGYGNFVLVDHGGQYYSTYAGLTGITAVKGRLVQAGTVLARADDDGVVRFELRKKREPQDPVKWIRIDCF
jgi:septal ring factor EnvC (AmiA/AmiB activator)